MISSKQPKSSQRLYQVLDLTSFDRVIEKILDEHIPFNAYELKSKAFLPSVYQLLANLVAEYKGMFYCQSRFATRSFYNAYQYEDRNEILDELECELRNRICTQLGVPYIKYGLRIEFITHNQWTVSYFQEG